MFRLVGSRYIVSRIAGVKRALAAGGVEVDSIDVSPLGEIDVKGLKIRLPGGEILQLDHLRGRIHVSGLLSATVSTTFDVGELVERYLSRRGLSLGVRLPADAVRFTMKGKASQLSRLDAGRLKGVLEIGRFSFELPLVGTVRVGGGTCSVEGGILTIRRPLVLSILDRMVSCKGSIRDLFRSPSFVNFSCSVRESLGDLLPSMIARFGNEELRRKFGMKGESTFSLVLDGSLRSPSAVFLLRMNKPLIQFRGTHRVINLSTDSLELSVDLPRLNPVSLLRTGLPSVCDGRLKLGRITGEYFELAKSASPHLYLHLDAVAVSFTWKERVIRVRKFVVPCYGGVWGGRGEVRLDRIPLEFSWRSWFRGLSLARFVSDVTSMDSFLDGTVDGEFSGHSKTLMLERIIAEGKSTIRNFSLVGWPEGEGEPPRDVKAAFQGKRFSRCSFSFKVDHAYMESFDFSGKGEMMEVAGSFSYNILTLALRAAFAFTSFVDGARLDVTIGGRAVEPVFVYGYSVAASGK